MYRSNKGQCFFALLIAVCGLLFASLQGFAVGNGTFYSNNVSISLGQDVLIPILIKNNPGIMGFSMKIQYDPNVLNANSVNVGELLPNGLFDYSIDSNNQGIIDVIFTCINIQYFITIIYLIDIRTTYLFINFFTFLPSY